MILKVFSMYDKGVGCFLQPFFARAPGEAVRMVQELVKSPETLMAKYPDQFAVYHVGEFHDDSGMFVLNTSGPTFVIGLDQLVEKSAAKAPQVVPPAPPVFEGHGEDLPAVVREWPTRRPN